LADLLRRFLEPDSGRILLDGRPLDDYRLADLRRRIVVVEHSPVLFRGSILDNLRYGHPEVDEAAVLLAARQSRVDDFVSTMSEGYGTWLSEGGSGLSTGQRQRIAIARAALARPLVVVLDEATSGLDAESARAVHRSLDAMFGDRTRLVITHRADDIERSDLCWRLEAGRLSPAPLAGR
jgi:ABC-type multidrug transport system fused ATPase/permease subunit